MVPEIMVPLVGHVNELRINKEIVDSVAKKVMEEKGVKMKYKIGTMIEIPRSALTADRIAEVAEFFSFGTNDLTQMTFGFSRDDAGKFLPEYLNKRIFDVDPFVSVDEEGAPVVSHPERCNGCGWCEIHCPDFAISIRERKPRKYEELNEEDDGV